MARCNDASYRVVPERTQNVDPRRSIPARLRRANHFLRLHSGGTARGLARTSCYRLQRLRRLRGQPGVPGMPYGLFRPNNDPNTPNLTYTRERLSWISTVLDAGDSQNARRLSYSAGLQLDDEGIARCGHSHIRRRRMVLIRRWVLRNYAAGGPAAGGRTGVMAGSSGLPPLFLMDDILRLLISSHVAWICAGCSSVPVSLVPAAVQLWDSGLLPGP